jgi:hypothetical protein
LTEVACDCVCDECVVRHRDDGAVPAVEMVAFFVKHFGLQPAAKTEGR